MVTAVQCGEQTRSCSSRSRRRGAVLNDPDFNVMSVQSRPPADLDALRQGPVHRQGVRQALAYTLDREPMVAQLFSGKADIGNDTRSRRSTHTRTVVPQRTRDVEKAKLLLAPKRT